MERHVSTWMCLCAAGQSVLSNLIVASSASLGDRTVVSRVVGFESTRSPKLLYYLLDSSVRESQAYHSQRHCVGRNHTESYGGHELEDVMNVTEVSCLNLSVPWQSALFNNASSKQALLHYPSRLVSSHACTSLLACWSWHSSDVASPVATIFLHAECPCVHSMMHRPRSKPSTNLCLLFQSSLPHYCPLQMSFACHAHSVFQSTTVHQSTPLTRLGRTGPPILSPSCRKPLCCS
jgi:hypothetical protein